MDSRPSTPRRRRRLGQHFLTRSTSISRVVAAIDPKPGEAFLEVGPGQGALTWPLLDAGVRLLAIEVDRRLALRLQKAAPPKADFRVVAADFLRLDLERTMDDFLARDERVRGVGNLPYSVATPILLRLLEMGPRFHDLTLMVQREVGDRILAPPGARDYGVLSLLCAYRAQAKPLLDLSPHSFSPPPEVDSTLLRFEPIAAEPSCPFPLFSRIVKAAFAGRRKTLRNSLAQGLGRSPAEVETPIRAAGLDPSARPQTLDLGQALELARRFRKAED